MQELKIIGPFNSLLVTFYLSAFLLFETFRMFFSRRLCTKPRQLGGEALLSAFYGNLAGQSGRRWVVRIY